MESYQVAVLAEPLLHKGRNVTANQGKANAFMKEYAAVNRLRFNKEEPQSVVCVDIPPSAMMRLTNMKISMLFHVVQA